ncbi:hypothetical protein PHPALM_30561, partial [Phytophthora palmivora]
MNRNMKVEDGDVLHRDANASDASLMETAQNP